MLFTILVLSQKLHAFNYRSSPWNRLLSRVVQEPLAAHRVLRNGDTPVAVVMWPPMQSLFKTTALNAGEWTLVVVAAFVSLL